MRLRGYEFYLQVLVIFLSIHLEIKITKQGTDIFA